MSENEENKPIDKSVDKNAEKKEIEKTAKVTVLPPKSEYQESANRSPMVNMLLKQLEDRLIAISLVSIKISSIKIEDPEIVEKEADTIYESMPVKQKVIDYYKRVYSKTFSSVERQSSNGIIITDLVINSKGIIDQLKRGGL